MWCVALASNNWFLAPAPGLSRPCATCGLPFPTVPVWPGEKLFEPFLGFIISILYMYI